MIIACRDNWLADWFSCAASLGTYAFDNCTVSGIKSKFDQRPALALPHGPGRWSECGLAPRNRFRRWACGEMIVPRPSIRHCVPRLASAACSLAVAFLHALADGIDQLRSRGISHAKRGELVVGSKISVFGDGLRVATGKCLAGLGSILYCRRRSQIVDDDGAMLGTPMVLLG